MTSSARSLEKLLNFRLWKLLTLSSAPVIRLCEGRFGISRREWALMTSLAMHSEGRVPAELAEQLGIDRAQVSKTCAALLGKGLIERRALRGDARRASFGLTDAGHALHAELRAEVQAINDRVTSVLDARQTNDLWLALDLLTAHADRVNREMVTDVSTNRSRANFARNRLDIND